MNVESVTVELVKRAEHEKQLRREEMEHEEDLMKLTLLAPEGQSRRIRLDDLERLGK